MQDDSQTLESATVNARPDSKTRRYDRQLRLWAASGQAALENARVLVISGSATSTSILKNLVLPGIGQFTILDDRKVTPEDAGNNFFLEGLDSVGKWRAEEAVRLLAELNEGVRGVACTDSLDEVLQNKKEWLMEHTIVIAHNLEKERLQNLSELVWNEPSGPVLFVVDSAGFLAEFSIQFHEHDIIESHSEATPSLRIDNAFPELLEHAMSLDFAGMDQTDHAHIPYVVILVRALEDWKKSHDGKPPITYAEKKEFKAGILAMRRKFDEENFEEAEAQAYKCWTSSRVPSDITQLVSLSTAENSSSTPFYTLLDALKKFTEKNGVLPLSSALPDMKASTGSYIELQKMYKKRADEEKEELKSFLTKELDKDVVDSFVKNVHGVKLLKGRRYGARDRDQLFWASAMESSPKAAATHLALLLSKMLNGQQPTEDVFMSEALKLLPPNTSLPDEFGQAIGELIRAPDADLPNTAAFLGGVVAQEVIKMITHQYVPTEGICIIDLIETWTTVL